MQKKFPLLKILMLFIITAFLCARTIAQLPRVNVTSNITTNTTWTNDKIWFLKKKVYVTQGAKLTIEPGTVIIGDTVQKGTLIITRGSKIYAVGTPCKPIVFTSAKKPGRRERGDWGGVILLGYAHINSPGDTNHIEGIEPIPNTLYGGGNNPNDEDNSGTMQYVRIEFAGVALSPNNEINGLTFGGVGSGTTINHVQVSFSNDDSYEWFGGSVNTKYLIAFRGIDDDFDTDQGYHGKNQFLFALRDPRVADISFSHGFESDNDATGSSNTPQTRPIFTNVTDVAGGDSTKNIYYEDGALLRRNSDQFIVNSIIMGWPKGIEIRDASTESNVLTDTLILNNIITAKSESNWIDTTPSNANVDDLLRNHAGNKFFHGNTGVKLKDPYTLHNPQPWPISGSPAVGNANFNHSVLNDPFFKKVGYIGAFNQGESNDWTVGWANWDPNSTDYSNGVPDCNEKPAVTEAESNTSTPIADVKVSPNPSQGAFNVAVSGFNISTVNLKVADLNTGKIYFLGKASNNSTTSINVKVPNGNYVVELTDGKIVISRKITVLN